MSCDTENGARFATVSAIRANYGRENSCDVRATCTSISTEITESSWGLQHHITHHSVGMAYNLIVRPCCGSNFELHWYTTVGSSTRLVRAMTHNDTEYCNCARSSKPDDWCKPIMMQDRRKVHLSIRTNVVHQYSYYSNILNFNSNCIAVLLPNFFASCPLFFSLRNTARLGPKYQL